MKLYRIAQTTYSTKDGRPITFEALPFNENKDKRGWVVHKINAYINNEYAGYINLSYIPKGKWDSIYHGNIWKLRKLANGHYDIPDEIVESNDEKLITEDHYERYNRPMPREHYEKYPRNFGQTYEEYVEACKESAVYWTQSEKEKAIHEYQMYELYFVDKPIVDFIRTEEKFQRQHVALALHNYANQWLKNNFGLHVWLSYCRTDMGKCFYDSKLLEIKQYKYKQKMTGGFRQKREYMAMRENWYKKASRSFEEHIKDVVKADLSSPIFMKKDGEIIDGAHRTCKAFILGRKIRAVILSQKELNRALLPKDSDYVGQIYRDDSKNEYSVTKLIDLYGSGKKNTVIANPEAVLKRSKDVWGKEVDIYAIIEEAKKNLL